MDFELIAIHDPDDWTRRILIRKADFDLAEHREWGSIQPQPAVTDGKPKAEAKSQANPGGKGAKA